MYVRICDHQHPKRTGHPPTRGGLKVFLKSDVAIGSDNKLRIQFASHAYNFSNHGPL